MKLLLSFIICLNSWSLTLDAEVDSTNVEVSELFDVLFRVGVDSDVKPKIEFDESNIELIDMEDEGVSSSVTYINGQVTKKTKYMMRYTFKAKKEGVASLQNIRASHQNEKARMRNLSFNVSKGSFESDNVEGRDIFVRAEPSKTDVYQNEGILLKYFLYYKVTVSNYNILEFPKLKGFMKRFFKERDYKETVNINGDRYNRIHMYSAVVFPEDINDLKIDSMTVEVTYPTGRSRRSLFGGFGSIGNLGLGFSGQKKKRFSSPVVNVKVKNLPLEGKPADFSGLVGKHTFDLKIQKDKLLVNEPLEVKLLVNGPGNLESYNGKRIFKESVFEEFERSSKFKITKTLEASKNFLYTYIAKSDSVKPVNQISFNYFDPITSKYVESTIAIAELKILDSTGNTKTNSSILAKTDSQEKRVKKVLAPSFGGALSGMNFHRFINGVLIFLCLGFGLSSFFGFGNFMSMLKPNSRLGHIKGNYENFGSLYNFLSPIESKDKDILNKVRNSSLSQNAKDYFENLIEIVSSKDYGQSEIKRKLKYKKKFFAEVLKVIDEESKES